MKTQSNNIESDEIKKNRSEILEKRKNKIQKRITRVSWFRFPAVAAGVIFILIALSILWWGSGNEKRQHVAECMIVGAGLLGISGILQATSRRFEEQLQDVEFESDLIRFEATIQESWAEKLLQINRLQLRRYYDLNLGQNSRIFIVGVLCILLGVAVIGVTLYLLSRPTDLPAGTGVPPVSDKLVLGLVGAIGSLLTNYVATVFLKMHSNVTASLTDFHAKLVHTHELFLANLLVSRIQDVEMREEAFAKLSIAIVGHKESPAPMGNNKN